MYFQPNVLTGRYRHLHLKLLHLTKKINRYWTIPTEHKDQLRNCHHINQSKKFYRCTTQSGSYLLNHLVWVTILISRYLPEMVCSINELLSILYVFMIIYVFTQYLRWAISISNKKSVISTSINR